MKPSASCVDALRANRCLFPALQWGHVQHIARFGVRHPPSIHGGCLKTACRCAKQEKSHFFTEIAAFSVENEEEGAIFSPWMHYYWDAASASTAKKRD